VVVRGGTSALGQAAINLARNLDMRVIAPRGRRTSAEAVIDAPELAPALRARTGGADGVLDLVGVRTLLDSLRIARYGGRVAMAGFLGDSGPIAAFDPMIVTHNANLVVNTDADQILVATAKHDTPGQLPTIRYTVGTLENPETSAAVCATLEGGERAFPERANRYRLR
jgi:NADPH:quinone reductase-like Zn-dependent oxidoreductase